MQVRSLVKRGTDKVVTEDLKLEQPRREEVLVRITSAGICRTDLEALDGSLGVPDPVVLGHEGAGIVEKVGEAVDTVEVGDTVILTAAACGQCPRCRAGRYTYCDHHGELNFAGTRLDGTTALTDAAGTAVHSHFFAQSSWSDHALAHHSNAIKVAAEADPRNLGPFGCGVVTGAGTVLNVLRVHAGSSVAVFGLGMVGQAAVMAARVAGATTIIAVAREQSSLDLAKQVGATHTVLAGPEVDSAAEIRAITGVDGVDYSVEATGSVAVMRTAIETVRKTGHAAITGVAPGHDIAIDAWTLINGRTVHGTVMGDMVPSVLLPQLVDLHLQGSFPINKLLTHYSFDDATTALADADAGRVVKAVLHPSQ